MILIMHPDGREEEIERPHPPTLEELQTWVGGWIEIPGGGFRTPSGTKQFVVNEEGKLAGLELNVPATTLYRAASGINWDVLVGNVVILTAPNLLD